MEGTCTSLPQYCEKAKSKEVQRAPAVNFICQNTECGKPLKPIPKISSGPSPLILGLAGVGLLLVAGALWASYSYGPGGTSCPADTLDAFLAASPKAEELVAAGKACQASIEGPSDHKLLAAVASLCRSAADAGDGNGALCLGELYDPVDSKPGRLGQMPSADLSASFDNYCRALKLGSSDAKARLDALKGKVSALSESGDATATELLDRWSRCGG